MPKCNSVVRVFFHRPSTAKVRRAVYKGAVITGLALCAGLAVAATNWLAVAEQASQLVAAPVWQDPVSHVDIFDASNEAIFPASWRSSETAASASPISPSARRRALRAVRVALSKYPPQFLQTNLKRIYLLGDLKFEGIVAAATNSADAVYITVSDNDPLYTDAFIEDTLHHEFGHLLQRNYREQWSESDWAMCNPPDFQYSSRDGVEAVRSGQASLTMSDEWNQQGFLSEYSASFATEDFATVSANLFLGEPNFWRRVDTFPALKNKINVAIAFYRKLDPHFDDAYFRRLSVNHIYVEQPVPVDEDYP